MSRENVPGTIYLLCLAGEDGTGGLRMDARRTARHYIGWTEGEVADRLQRHLDGRGSPMIRAAIERGLDVVVARTWTGDRYRERELKRRRNAGRLCPICCEREGLTLHAMGVAA